MEVLQTNFLKQRQQLEECLDESGLAWKLNPGDGAFYGPKIDIQVSGGLMFYLQTYSFGVRQSENLVFFLVLRLQPF